MKLRVLIAAIFVLVQLSSVFALKPSEPVLNDNLISWVNSRNVGWKAGRNSRFEGISLEEARAMTCIRPSWDGSRRFPTPEKKLTGLPNAFDARSEWGSCIGGIRNQEQCGSCWAFSASEVLGDRYCIEGGSAIELSPEYVLECDTYDDGCNGGNLNTVWQFLTQTGTCTEACDPYVSGGGSVPDECPSSCSDGSSLQVVRSTGGYQIVGVSNIMNEIYTNGPVQAAFDVYQDFFSYTGGVYVYQSGSLVGGHAIKIIGWGFDSSTNQPYWVVQNSWGPSWGLQGYFWILRGANECGIEDDVWAGKASV